jgi:hypothetical protein
MMTIRSHDQFNTTIYGLDDRYRGIHGGRRVIFMNRDDIAEAGLKDRQLVNLTSHFQGERRTIRDFSVIPYDHPSALRSDLLPRDESTGRARKRGRNQQHSGVKVDRDLHRTSASGCRQGHAVAAMVSTLIRS